MSYDCVCRTDPHHPACLAYNQRKEKEMSAPIDYLSTAMTLEQQQQQEAFSMLVRALLYLKFRRPNEQYTLEFLQDRIDAMEGERRAKLIN